MESDLSLVRFAFMNFWGVLITSRPLQPISTLLIKLTEALINSEPKPDKKLLDRVQWIHNNTSSRVMVHLSLVELIVFKNIDKGVNKEVEIGDKTFTIAELYYILDDISEELSRIVIEIGKKYGFDIPVMSNNYGSTGQKNVNFE